jgi:hypothetical protein
LSKGFTNGVQTRWQRASSRRASANKISVYNSSWDTRVSTWLSIITSKLITSSRYSKLRARISIYVHLRINGVIASTINCISSCIACCVIGIQRTTSIGENWKTIDINIYTSIVDTSVDCASGVVITVAILHALTSAVSYTVSSAWITSVAHTIRSSWRWSTTLVSE